MSPCSLLRDSWCMYATVLGSQSTLVVSPHLPPRLGHLVAASASLAGLQASSDSPVSTCRLTIQYWDYRLLLCPGDVNSGPNVYMASGLSIKPVPLPQTTFSFVCFEMVSLCSPG